jgi:disease resistance protein RPM1
MASSSWYSSILSESKYLTVLDLSGLPIVTLPFSVGELFSLRFLCLNDTNVKELPRSFTKLHNLQTLSLQRTQVVKFPRGFSKLKNLRHLLFWNLLDAAYRSFHNWESLEPFEGLWNLNDLQSLKEVRATKVLVAKLGNLSELRTLCITHVRSSHCADLCKSLSKMHKLTRLHIRATNKDELLLLDDLTLQSPLEKLDLVGQLSERTLESPFVCTHANQLLQLNLSWCQLTESPVLRLFKLSNLTELRLIMAYSGEQLYFQADWFLNLRMIVLMHLQHVNKICIDEGALMNLEYLHICNLEKLQDIPIGVNFLTSLKEAYFMDMHSDFARNFQREKLHHIPKVYWTPQGKRNF